MFYIIILQNKHLDLKELTLFYFHTFFGIPATNTLMKIISYLH